MRRRGFIGAVAGTATLALVPRTFWGDLVHAAPAVPGAGPYGPLQPPDANGIELPVGFTSRVVARTGEAVAPSAHVWHTAPDGGECIATGDGGWIYVSNSEIGSQQGGAGAIRFAPDGSIVDSYSILTGTNWNCAGGMTPWGTWLSCEESGSVGEVYECDPFQPGEGVVRPLLGSFNHEAAVVDPATGHLYLTEDHVDGRLYKFVPTVQGNLTDGVLYAAAVTDDVVSWVPTLSAAADRQQETTAFKGGEGIHIGDGVIYFATKIDNRIWELDLTTSVLSVAYDCAAHPEAPLQDVDNVTVHGPTGRVFVAEDVGNMELAVMHTDATGARSLSILLRVQGQSGSEVAGQGFSPDGTRMYFSSQRGIDSSRGITYEIVGPFAATVEPEPEPDPEPEPEPEPEPVTLLPTGAYVRGGSYADTNLPGGSTLQFCYNGSAQYTRRTVLTAPIAPTSGPFASATLSFSARVWNGGSSGEVVAVAGGWDPATVTWNTQPEPVGPVLSAFDLTSTRTRFVVDVTDRLNELHAAGATQAAFSVRQTQRNGPLGYVDAPGRSDAPELVLVPLGSGEPPPPPPPPPTTTVTVPIVRDSWARGGTHANSTWGSSRLLNVCNNGNEQYTRWAYLGVDLPAIGTPLASAILRLNARTSSGGPSAHSITATTGGWVDDELTWNNRPAPVGSPLIVFDVVDTDSRWYELDLTAHVEAARASGATTVELLLRQEQRNGPLVYVNPSNHWTGDRPEIVLSY